MLACRFRLYPNKEEELKLLRTKEVCRRVYNRFLELSNEGEHDRFKLQALPPVWKSAGDDLRGVHSKVLQYELHRPFSNLTALRELKERGRKIGKLRFNSETRFKTLTCDRTDKWLEPKNDRFCSLPLSKIGGIPMRMHTAAGGDVKGVIIEQMPSGKWFAFLFIDDGRGLRESMVIEKTMGIDVGLKHCPVDSDGI